MRLTLALVAVLSLFTPITAAQEHEAAAAQPAFKTTDGYPVDACVVTDEALDEKAKVFTVDGRTFKTCCGRCRGKVQKDPETFAEKKDAAVVAAQMATYPLDTCPISGKKLGAMGDPVDLVVDNTLIRLCCSGCEKKAVAKATEITARLQAAAFAAQNASYAATICPVSGHEIDDDAVAVMHGTKLVKLCCADCFDKFAASPNAMAAKVPAAKTKSAGEAKAGAEKAGGDKSGGDGQAHGNLVPMAQAAAAANKDASCIGTDCCAAGSGCCQQTAGAAKPATTGCCEAKPAAPPTEAKPAGKVN